MPVSVEIGGNSVRHQKGSFHVDLVIEERSTAGFTVVDTDGALTFVRGEQVEIFDAAAVLIFAGFIAVPGTTRPGPTADVLYHDITCMDNHFLADKRLVVKAYADKTLAHIVGDIRTDYLAAEGVTVGSIQTGPTIKEAIFNYISVTEAFDAIAELSGYIWFIDENKKLYFIDRTTYAAPWDLDNVTYRPIKGSCYRSGGNPLYRNKQYIRGGVGLTALQSEVFSADGVMQSFAVGYPIAQAPTITDSVLGGRTVGIKGVDTGTDYYWNKGDSVVTATVIPVNGRTVTVAYYGQYPLIGLASNATAQAARAAIEGGTGITEDMVVEAQHDTADGVREAAKGKLTHYCQNAERFSYQTVDRGLYPGQLQKITYAPFGYATEEMLIESVTITAYGETVYYDVTCITGPVLGSWTKFFTSLLRRPTNSISLGDGLLLVLLHQAENLPLAETTALHSDAFPPDVSRWIAYPPAQGAAHHVRHEALALVEGTLFDSAATEDYLWE